IKADAGRERPAPLRRARTDRIGSGMDQAVFDAWAETIRPRLMRLAYRFLWNRHDAEEIVQDALLLAWQRARQLSDLARRNAWIYRATIHGSLNRRRRLWRRTERSTEGMYEAEAAQSSEPETD